MRKIDIGDGTQLVSAIKEHLPDGAIHLHDGERELAVVLSPERYQELLMKGVEGNVRPLVVELLDESIKKHGAVYQALAKLD